MGYQQIDTTQPFTPSDTPPLIHQQKPPQQPASPAPAPPAVIRAQTAAAVDVLPVIP